VIYPKLGELEDFVGRGYCSKRKHSKFPIWIYNYSAKAQYDFGADTWPDPLRDARGLVLDATGDIVGRGFRKFFNLSQLHKLPDGEPQFWEKVDGSLILVFGYAGERVCATRGSFESEQAIWAEEHVRAIQPDFVPASGHTFLFEAIYPANRIVVDYGDTQELVFLAEMKNDEGVVVAGKSGAMPFRKAAFHGYHDAQSLPAREGEGFVLYWPDGTMAKVKLEEYTAVHRMLFGTSTRSVWESLRAGKDPAKEADRLPEKPREWITAYAEGLKRKHAELVQSARREHDEFLGARSGEPCDRKTFAAWATRQNYPALLFRIFDKKPDVDDMGWKLIEPEFERPSWAAEPEE
jgi:RNA ligase